jgi:hypothetical protein
VSNISCSTDLSIFQQKQKGLPGTHKALLGQVLAGTTNKEGITYDNADDDVHNIDMMDIYKN